jgi:putative CocE/NonD family hydrolase
MVPLSAGSSGNGKRLYTKFYLPRGKGPWPVTFQRSCYKDQIEILDWMAEQMALRGFASGYQMCRGTGASEGEWQPFVNERSDGIDALDWICRQEWAGDIGLYGLSYLGFTQWMIADIVPDRVKTMVISQAGIDRYHANYSNGMFRHDVYTAWAMSNAGKTADGKYPDCCFHRPFISVDEDVWHVRLDWFRDWISHADFSDSYWNTGIWKTLRDVSAGIKVPVCLVGGWYDHHLEGMFYAYNRLDPNVKKQSRFVIGPWNHGLGNCVDPYPLPDSEKAGTEAFCESFRWLDGFLKGRDIPMPGLDAYIIGEGRWKNYPLWPPVEEHKIFYLKAGAGGRGSLATEIPPDGKSEYEYDPAKPPVEAIGAESMLASPPEKRGSRLQPLPYFRSDVLSFLSEPLEEDLLICGESRVIFFARSSAPDTAFAVKLSEMFPGGDSYNIRSGITSIGYRNDAPQRLSYTPGETVKLTIGFWPLTWKLHKGSRLRLDVMSTLFPEFNIHPNTDERWAFAQETRPAFQTILSGGGYPSMLKLAVEPIPYISLV